MDINKLVSDELAKNHQINTFTKGMNSDTAYDLIDSNQYLFGQNIRITNNTLLLGDFEQGDTEQVVSPVPVGKVVCSFTTLFLKVLASGSIGNVGVLVVLDYQNYWRLYKLILADDGNSVSYKHIYTSSETVYEGVNRFSMVVMKEVEGVIKAYIADGNSNHSILQVFVENYEIGDDSALIEYYNGKDDDDLQSGVYFPYGKMKLKLVSGNLKTQQVQYTYRFYRKYGVHSKCAPLSMKLQIISPNRQNDIGNAEDTTTSVGVRLLIDCTGAEEFNYILIFRISYIHPGQQPLIYVIYDEKVVTQKVEINGVDKDIFVYTDKGSSLSEYSLDEFAALNEQLISPKVIEQLNGYLFYANCKDNTIVQLSSDYEFDPTVSLCRTTIVLDSDKTTNTTNIQNDEDVEDIEILSGWTAGDVNSENYLENDCGIEYSGAWCYDNPIISSCFRSLRSNEFYKYGVVFYDKKGNRTKVYPISENNTVSDTQISYNNKIYHSNNAGFLDKLYTRSYGIRVTVDKPSTGDIVGFKLVRREKTHNFKKNLAQVALSRPINLAKYSNITYNSPYYPNVFLSSQFFYISYYKDVNEAANTATYTENYVSGHGLLGHVELWANGDMLDINRAWKLDNGNPRAGWPVLSSRADSDDLEVAHYFDWGATNTRNFDLFLLYAPEINIKRRDTLQELSESNVTLSPIAYVYDDKYNNRAGDSIYGFVDYVRKDSSDVNRSVLVKADGTSIGNNEVGVEYRSFLEDATDSGSIHSLSNEVYVSYKYSQNSDKSDKIANSVSVKYYNILNLLDFAIQDYDVQQVSDVKNPNWEEAFSNVSLIGDTRTAIKLYKSYLTTIGKYSYVNWVCNGMYDAPATSTEKDQQLWLFHQLFSYSYVFPNPRSSTNEGKKDDQMYGWEGPGPVCLLAALKHDNTNTSLYRLYAIPGYESNIGTLIANVTHSTIDYVYTDPYYCFGPFYSFDGSSSKTAILFDGDTYMVPAEFTNLFKTYDFNDQYFNLISGQMVYYIPLESTINTYFDYGMNYRNTSSANLTLEPSTITGVQSTSRALHQYNMVYSDNENSIDVFFEDPDENPVTRYNTRIYYSQLKTNGEKLDNWQIVKPADFIDADSRWGDVTNLLSNSTSLYFWQEHGFGKLSVNERSLITDNSGETIQLGQGGVLNRTDYLSTNYGMRAQDFSAVNTENAIFWIDVLNTAILMCNKESVINYGEALNVQNIINSKFDNSYIPSIKYDLLNNELLCQCLDDYQQIVFNTKYNIATSIYTREYFGIINIADTLLTAYNPELLYTQAGQITTDAVSGSATFVPQTDGIAILKSLIDSSTNLSYPCSVRFGAHRWRVVESTNDAEHTELTPQILLYNLTNTDYNKLLNSNVFTLEELLTFTSSGHSTLEYPSGADTLDDLPLSERIGLDICIAFTQNGSGRPDYIYAMEYVLNIALNKHNVKYGKNFNVAEITIDTTDYYLIDFSDYTSETEATLYIESAAGQYASTAAQIVENIAGLELCKITKINKLKYQQNQTIDLLSPTILEFVVNQTPTTTKVFDNQKLTLLKKRFELAETTPLMPNYLASEKSSYVVGFDTRLDYTFSTDIASSTNNPIYKTDREGNILYDIPRTKSSFNNKQDYGNRIRGKWMKEKIVDNNPSLDHCISHIVTKFRQSYI